MTLHPSMFVTNDSNDLVGPVDARLGLAGLLSGTGVLVGGAVSGNTNGPNMKYDIAAGVWSVARGDATSDGLYLVANDATITVDSGSAAPASGSRYDLVWIRQQNAYTGDGFGDTSSDPEVGVTVGAASPTPTKPTGSLPDGALVLAECLVDSTANNGGDATIDNTVNNASTNNPVRTDDWNTADDVGLYYSAYQAPNGPYNGSVAGIVVGTAAHPVQIVWGYGADAGQSWTREYLSGVWQEWKQLSTQMGAGGLSVASAASLAAVWNLIANTGSTAVDPTHGGTGMTSVPTSQFLRGSGGGGSIVGRTFAQTWDDIVNQGTVALDPGHGGTGATSKSSAWNALVNQGSTAVDGSHGGTGMTSVPAAQYIRGSTGGGSMVARTYQQTWDDIVNQGTVALDGTHGGTGMTSIPAAQYIRGSGGGGSMVSRSYQQVWDDIVNQGTKPLDPKHGGTGASGAPAKSYPRGSDTGSGNLAWRTYQQVMSDLYGDPQHLGDNQNLNTSGLLGVYYATSSNASTGSNFPVNSGGMLEAFSQGSLGLVQRYTVYDGSAIYARTFYDFGSVWSPWQLIGGDTGWKNCSMKSGVTGQIQARVLNGVVYFKGHASFSLTANNSKAIFSLPSSIPNPPDDMGGNPANFAGGFNIHDGTWSMRSAVAVDVDLYGISLWPYPAS